MNQTSKSRQFIALIVLAGILPACGSGRGGGGPLPPGSFSLLSPAAQATGTILLPTLSWEAAGGADSYDLEISRRSDFASLEISQAGLTTTSFTPGAPLLPFSRYYWRVTAVNSVGTTLAAGAPRYFTTLAPTPATAPVGEPDPTFGGGIVNARIAPPGSAVTTAQCVVRAPDGRLVAVGWHNTGSDEDYVISRFLSHGTPDPSLGGTGVVRILQPGNQRAYSAVVQPDGKIVVAGSRTEAVARYNVDGSPDATFDGDGYVNPGLGVPATPRALALQADGKILVCGAAQNGLNGEVAVARLLANGSPDPSFGGDGLVQFPLAALSDSFARSIAVQADGKIVLACRIANTSASIDFVVVRLLSNGSFDASFDGDGIASVDVSVVDNPNSIAIQGDGKIVVAGEVYTGSSYAVGVIRLNSNGSPDASFNGTGKLVVDLTLDNDEACDVAMAPDGKIVIGGLAGTAYKADPAVLRILSNGTLDPGFAEGGIRIHKLTTNAFRSILVQPDGAIVGCGSLGGLLLVRYLPDGSLDPLFSPDGKADLTLEAFSLSIRAAAVQPDGKIVVAGSLMVNPGVGLLVSRFTASGTPDFGFGVRGSVLTTFGSDTANGNAVALQPDGKIVVAGCLTVGGVTQMLVARYLTTGALDPAFDGDGLVTLSYGSVDQRANAVAILPDGKILIVGSVNMPGDSDIAVVRLTAAGAPDPTFDGDGRLSTHLGFGWDYGHALAVYPDGRFLVAAAGDNSAGDDGFVLVRYQANGALDTAFDGDGVRWVPIGNDEDQALAVTLMPDGRIVAAGSTRVTGQTNVAVVRLLPDGALDESFAAGGIYTANLGSTTEAATSVAVQADGAVLIAGDLTASPDFAVARLTPFGVLDSTFGGGDGIATLDFDSDQDTARTVILLPGARLLLAGTKEWPEKPGVVVFR